MGDLEPSGLWSLSHTTASTSSSTEFLENPLLSARQGPWLPSSGLMVAPVLVHLSLDGATTSLKVSLTPAPSTTCPTVSSSGHGATYSLFPASSISTSSSSNLS